MASVQQLTDETPTGGPRAWLLFFAEGGLVLFAVWAYWPVLTEIVTTWFSDPDYTHGLFVVPIALWLLWARRNDLPPNSTSVAWIALTLPVLAGLMRYLAGRFYLPQVDAWSIPIWIAGVVWLFHGVRCLTWAAPSIAFLWFAMPLPGRLEEAVSAPLQRLAASLSTSGLLLLGQPAVADGTTILLGDNTLDVERACSGLRMFYGMFALAVACVAVTRPRRWKAAIVLLSAVPIAVAANALRIVVTGLLVQHASNAAAARFTHDLAGLFMIALAAVAFMLLLWFLKQTERRFAGRSGRGMTWLVGWTVAAIGVAACCFVGIGYQRDRAYVTLLEAADHLELGGDRLQAVAYLERYVTARPEDTDALIRLADSITELSHNRGEKLRAIELYRVAFLRSPDRSDLVKSAVTLASSLGEYRTAVALCREALGDERTRAASARDQLVKLQADTLIEYIRWEDARADNSWRDAEVALRRAIEVPHYEIRHASALATVLREHSSGSAFVQRNEEADELMNRVVRDYPTDPMAWLTRYRYRLEFGRGLSGPNAAARADLAKAIELADASGDAEAAWQVYVAAARHHRRRHELDVSRRFLAKAINTAPDHAQAYAMLADMDRTEGGATALRRAEDVLRQGLSAVKQDELTLRLPLAYVLADEGKFDAAEEQVEPLVKAMPQLADPQRAVVEVATGLVRARIETGRGDPYAAIRRLAHLVAAGDAHGVGHTDPQLLSQTWTELAKLYADVGNLDQALGALQQTAHLTGESAAWRQLVGTYALRAGNLEAARGQYQALAAEQPAVAWLSLANIAVRQQLARRRGERDWAGAETALQHARDAKAPADACAVVEAELLVAQDEIAAARKVLQTAGRDNPESSMLLRGLAVVENRLGNYDRAIEAARRYVQHSGQSVDAVILYASVLEDAGRDQEALAALTSRADAPGRADDEAALALAHYYLRYNDSQQAIAAVEDYLDRHPKSLRVTDFLANWAWLNSDWSALEKYERRLATDIEGEEGTLWRAYKIQRLLAHVQDRSDPQFEEAVSLSRELLWLRPEWPKTQVIAGELELVRGNTEAAVDAYERAWRLGGRGVVLADRLIDQLTQLGRYDEAENYVEQAAAYLAISPQFFDHAVPYYARSGEGVEALRVAEAWVQQRPNDPSAYLRLGRVLRILGEGAAAAPDSSAYLDRAEKAFQTAVQIDPTKVQPWIDCVMFYARGETRRAKAMAVLADFANQVSIDAVQREFVLGQLYENLAMPAEAELHYTLTMQELPGDLGPHQQSSLIGRIASFYTGRTPWLAEQLARRALTLNSDNDRARRILLRVLSLRNDPTAINEAQTIIREWKLEPRDLLDRRAFAMILARTGRRDDVLAAIELLESALQTTADDKLLLVRLYEQTDRVGAAYGLLEDLTSASAPRPGELAEYLRFWQVHFFVPADPDQSKFRDRAAAAYANLLSMPDQEPEWLRWKIRERCRQNGGKSLSNDEALADVATLWQAVQKRRLNTEQLEPILLRTFSVLLTERQGEAALALARHPPQPVTQDQAIACLAQSLIVAGGEDSRRVPGLAEFFGQAKSDPAVSLAAAVAIGDYEYMSGQYAAAADSYRRVLERDPDHTTAQNNLALALVEQQGQQALARRVCERALRESPDDPSVRDTLAVLEMVQGHAVEAIRILDGIVAQTPDNAVVHLHRSMAHRLCGDDVAAQQAFADAMGLGLARRLLSPRDREFVDEMLHVMPSTADRPSSRITRERASRS